MVLVRFLREKRKKKTVSSNLGSPGVRCRMTIEKDGNLWSSWNELFMQGGINKMSVVLFLRFQKGDL